MTRERIVPFYGALEDRVRAIGGVAGVAFVSEVPMRFGQKQFEIVPDGYVPSDRRESVTVGAAIVSADYFDVLGIPILRGRAFRQTDGPDCAPVAVVNEAFVQKYFPDGQGLGRKVRLVDGSSRSLEIVGIARQSKYSWIAEPPTEFLYLPFLQQPQARTTAVLETRGDAATFAAPVRQALRDLDPDQAASAVMTMRDFYRRQVIGVPTTLIQTIGALGAIGLALAMVGLYGLVSYLVSVRTREIGVRMALGASRGQILRSTVREGAVLSVAGIIVGAIAALIARQALLAAFSTGTDLPAYVLLPIAVPIVTPLAAWVPARRAASVEPSIVLRNE